MRLELTAFRLWDWRAAYCATEASLSAKDNVRNVLANEGTCQSIKMRQPGIEPGSTAWKAAMLTTIPLTLVPDCGQHNNYQLFQIHGCNLKMGKKSLPWPGFEPGLLRPQRRVLTTRRSRLETLSGVKTFYQYILQRPPFQWFHNYLL